MDSSLDKFNANKIEDNIYLGGYKTAIDKEFLEKYQIKRILSIHEKLIRDSQKVQNIYYKHIIVEDKKTEEIITYFPECYEFIAIAQTYDESVLIHCQDGVSRSSTIVIAYVMKKYKISVENAIQKVKDFRECVEPNDGFLSQLQLWERISYQIDINNRQLREFLFEVLRTKGNAVLLLNESNLQTLHEKYFPHFLEYFEKIALFEENDRSLNKWETYYCLDCDKELFNEFNVFKSNENSKCRFIYVEPIQWFIAHLVKWSQSLSDLMTRYILCPKCDRELGSYNWQRIEDICDCLSHKGIDFFSVFKINSDCVKTTLNYIRIDENVYLGDEITATDEELLKKFNIKRIVSILESEIPDFLKVENIFTNISLMKTK